MSPVLVKYAAILTGLLLVMGLGVRPALKRAGAAAASAHAANGPRGAKELAGPAGAPLAAPEPPQLDAERVRAQEIFEQVTGQVKKQPAQTSRLLQSWIHSD